MYGQTPRRLDWLLQGPDNGRLSDSGAGPDAARRLSAHAPPRGATRAARPTMQTEGMLASDPAAAYVAGDVRANDNAELTAVQTLFAREHNRIAAAAAARRCPRSQRFQIARRVVVAEQQYITYTQFLPAMGVRLAPYRGYRPGVDTELADEFATVGYRAHSMVNGEEHIYVPAARLRAARRGRACSALGVKVSPAGSRPAAHPRPGRRLLSSPGAARDRPGAVLRGLAQEPGYRNDVQFDDSLRSTLFAYPGARQPGPGGVLCQGPADRMLHRRLGPGRDRHPARARPRDADLRPAAPGPGPVGAARASPR